MASTTLRSIELEGFRSIRKQPSLRLNSGLNVLIGGNGAGKSNFISFFQMLGAMMDTNLGLQRFIAETGGADAMLFRGVEETQEFTIKLEFANNTYEMTLRLSDDGRMFFAKEDATFQGNMGLSTYGKTSGHFESWVPKAGGFPAGEKFTKDALSGWRVYHFQNTSRTAALMRAQNAVDNERLWPDAGNIAPFLLRLREEQNPHYKRIVSHIQQAAPFFGDFDLKPDAQGKVQLLWTERYSPKLYYPHQLSDGTLRFICLAALLLQPEPPSCIIIDEPELGLHPFAITVLAGMFRLAEEGCQLIVSTQSSPLVDHLQVEDLIVVDRVDGGTVLTKPKLDVLQEWLDEYSLGELWDKNLLGGMPQP